MKQIVDPCDLNKDIQFRRSFSHFRAGMDGFCYFGTPYLFK